jgi:hypothetical protein
MVSHAINIVTTGIQIINGIIITKKVVTAGVKAYKKQALGNNNFLSLLNI